MPKNFDSITELVQMCHDNAVEKGFHTPPRPIPEDLVLIHSEVSEALEEFREGNHGLPLSELSFEGDKPVGFASEIADILIRVFDTCGHLEIPIVRVLQKKIEYNATRPHRHGGKKA